MENASKALIIAGAILIAILLISVGIIVFNSTGGVTKRLQSEMSEQEINMFNEKFTKFEGTKVRGTTVKSLLQTVYINNQDEDMPEVKVTSTVTNNEFSDSNLNAGPNSAWINTSATYKVVCGYDEELVNKVTISNT